MNVMRITGPTPLQGSVKISGSKNAALPAMAAALLTDKTLELRNVPAIEDIGVMISILLHLGVEAEQRDLSSWRLCANSVVTHELNAKLTGRMRGSLLLLGALIARCGQASIAKPGGDDIGMRRVEQHLEGLRAMGAKIHETADGYLASASQLRGAAITLDMPTVTGTENLVMAAATAQGTTTISNAAREPHVVDVARCLNAMGAKIEGVGTDTITIVGTGSLLNGARHNVTTDYIEAGTYMTAAAATQGNVEINDVHVEDVRALSNKLRAAGCEVIEGQDSIRVSRHGELKAVDATTWPHPGFATDLQPQYVALMTQAQGTSIISEALFENRFRHVTELCSLGAKITTEGRSAIVNGPKQLQGNRVAIADIRSGAALVIAALCATGVTTLSNIFHLDRGYERFDDKLRALGANIVRDTEATSDAVPVPDYSRVIGD